MTASAPTTIIPAAATGAIEVRLVSLASIGLRGVWFITERAAHRIVTELADGGYITRERNGRRNQYTIQAGLPLPDRLGRVQRISDLLTILIGTTDEFPDARVPPAAPNGKTGR